MIAALFVLLMVEAVVEPTAPDLLGVAAVITAVGVTFASIVSSVILVVAKATAKKVTQIDHAVNGQPAGTKPMVDQVQDLHAQIPVPLDQADLDQAALLPLVRRLVLLAEANAAVLQAQPPDDA